MTTQHTPGPWVTKAQGDANHYFTLHNGKWLVSIQFNGELSVPEQEANARLIDTAPELLESAIALLWKLEGMALHESHYADLRSAIFKATGFHNDLEGATHSNGEFTLDQITKATQEHP